MVDREFQNLQRELRASLRQKSRLAEVGAATNKINHDLRNMLSTARLLSDRLARSDDERTRALAPTILNTIDRAARLASDAIEYVRDRPTPRIAEIDLADLVDEVGVALQEQGEDSNPNIVRHWINEVGDDQPVRADRDLLYRVFVNLGRNAFEAGATTVTVRARANGGYLAGRRRRQRPRRAAGSGRRRSSAPSPPAAAPAAPASASPSPATWCASTAATSPSPRPAPGHDVPVLRCRRLTRPPSRRDPCEAMSASPPSTAR